MADMPTTSACPAWASASTTIDTLHQQLGSATDNRRALEDRLAEAEEDLLDLRAPDLAGTVRKLELLWDGKLHGQDQISTRKLMILNELRCHATA